MAGIDDDISVVLIVSRNADADIVVEHIDTPPTFYAPADGGRNAGFVGNVGHDREGLSTLRGDHLDRLSGGLTVAVDREHTRALTREKQGGGAAVSDGGAGRLARADDDRDLVLKPHYPAFRHILRFTTLVTDDGIFALNKLKVPPPLQPAHVTDHARAHLGIR